MDSDECFTPDQKVSFMLVKRTIYFISEDTKILNRALVCRSRKWLADLHSTGTNVEFIGLKFTASISVS